MVTSRDLQALEAALADHTTTWSRLDLGAASAPASNLVASLAQAVHASRSAVTLTDPDLEEPGPRIRYVNPACEALTGYSAAELIGRTPRMLQGPATDRAVLDELRGALATGGGFEGKTINYRADGTPFVMAWRVSPVRDTNGTTTGYVAIQDDITATWLAELRVHERLTMLQGMIAPPVVPELDHLEIVVVQEPADDQNHVGGDWCDVVVGPDGRVHLIVGDVTGHGVLAALQVGRFRWTLRALLRSGIEPARALRTLAEVNEDAPVFASIGLVSIDRVANAEIITAGHPDVIIRRADHHERIRSGAPLIGVGRPEDPPDLPVVVALAPGDVVSVYSDGLIERRDEDVDAVIDSVARWIDAHPIGAAGLREHATQLVRDARGPSHDDDVMVVMARVKGC